MQIGRPKRTIRNTLTTIVALLVLGAGLYVLITALLPLISTQMIDPNDNPTVTKLVESADKPIKENRLYIPKININLPYNPGDETVMEHGAWWRKPENGDPKKGGNFILSAHRFIMGVTPAQTLRKSPFYAIDKLKVGDEMIVDYEGKRYTYTITTIHTVAPTAVEIEAPTKDDRLTLYSCTLGGASDGREVIIATPKESEKNDK